MSAPEPLAVARVAWPAAHICERCDRLNDPARDHPCPCLAWWLAHARDAHNPQKGTRKPGSSLSGQIRGRNGAVPHGRVTTERGRAA